jgi:hypothetical protein
MIDAMLTAAIAGKPAPTGIGFDKAATVRQSARPLIKPIPVIRWRLTQTAGRTLSVCHEVTK